MILTLTFVTHCSPGAKQSVFRACMCVPAAVCDDSVEIRTLGTLMVALVMLNVLHFGNCGHIVIMATRGQIVGANHRYSSPATSNERDRGARVYRCQASSHFSCFVLHTRKLRVLMAYNMVYYPQFGDLDTYICNALLSRS